MKAKGRRRPRWRGFPLALRIDAQQEQHQGVGEIRLPAASKSMPGGRSRHRRRSRPAAGVQAYHAAVSETGIDAAWRCPRRYILETVQLALAKPGSAFINKVFVEFEDPVCRSGQAIPNERVDRAGLQGQVKSRASQQEDDYSAGLLRTSSPPALDCRTRGGVWTFATVISKRGAEQVLCPDARALPSPHLTEEMFVTAPEIRGSAMMPAWRNIARNGAHSRTSRSIPSSCASIPSIPRPVWCRWAMAGGVADRSAADPGLEVPSPNCSKTSGW